MYDGALDLQIGGKLLKIHYRKLTHMLGVKHSFSLFFNNSSNIPIVNRIITTHKEIYNLFGSCIYHKPHLSPIQDIMFFIIIILANSSENIPVGLDIFLEVIEIFT